MKYFFALLLTGLISFNTPSTYGATTQGEEASEQLQPTSPPAKQAEDTKGQAQSEETTTEPPAPKPEEATAEQPFKPKPLYLEHTRIGRAVIEGNVEEYKAALAELIEVFNTSLPDVLKKRTSKEETLLDLMIIAEKNREYFTSEMFHLLVFKALFSKGLTATQETQLLLDRAHQAKNEIAIRLLSSIETVFKQYETEYKETTAQHTEESIRLREQIINLAKRQYSKTKIAFNTGLATAGGALSIWGYKLFTQSSPHVTSPLPQVTEFLATVSDKDVAVGVMAVGVGVAAKGAHKCVKTFARRRQLNREHRQLNR